MTIKQLSIFLENKTGRINDLTKILGKYGINMHAFSMAETTDFGILRLIVSDVERAVEVLRNENFAVMLTDVVCISCPNVAGSLSESSTTWLKTTSSSNTCTPLPKATKPTW